MNTFATIALGSLGIWLAVLSVDSTTATNRAAERTADCLWLLARNHGFYTLQSNAIDIPPSKAADDENHALWLGFVKSEGARECSADMRQLPAIVAGLRRTRSAADRHFLAGEPSSTTAPILFVGR